MTAVEWLVEDLGAYLPISITSVQLSIEQAKEMEKQQIIEAIAESNKSNNRNVSLNPKQYYNERFKKEIK